MPELERPSRTRDEPGKRTGGENPDRTERAGDVTALEIAGTDVSISGDPSDAEAAALSAVLAEHLRTEAEAADAEEPRYAVDPWCLAGRLGRRSPRRVPAACRSGREWKVAGRDATW